MPPALRILFVAEPAVAVEALAAVREGGPVQAQLAPTATALRETLIHPDAGDRWDAVVFAPGGPVEEVEVAVFVPDGVPLFVLDNEVPLLLSETAAQAVTLASLPGLHARLAVPAADAETGPASPAHAPAVPAPPARPAVPPASAAASLASPAPQPAGPAILTASPAGEGELATREPASNSVPDLEPAEPDRAGSTLAPDGPDSGSHADGAPADSEPAGRASLPETATPAATLHLSSLADHLPIGLYRSTPDGHILYANPALAHLLGVASPEALSALDVHADLGYPREAFSEQIHATGAVRNLIVSWTRRSGDVVHTRENARAIHSDTGELLCYEGTMEDVTAEVEAQREEQATARQHRAVAGFAALAADATDPETLFCAAAGALLDATAADWACLTLRDGRLNRIAATAGTLPAGLAGAFEPEGGLAHVPVPARALAVSDLADLDAPRSVLDALAQAGVTTAGLAPLLRGAEPLGVLAWGREAPGGLPAAEIRAAEALAWHVGGHLDRAAALGELRDAEASLAVLADRTLHVLYRLRYAPDGPTFDYLSPAVERLTGYSRAEIEARGGLGTLVEHREAIEGDGLATGPVEGARRYHAVYRMTTAHGMRWVENDARPWLDHTGQPVGIVGVFQDITERKERQDELADTAQTALIRQRALVDLSHLDGADAFGAPAAAIAAATLGAADVSFWLCGHDAPCQALYAPAPSDPGGDFDGALASVLHHVVQHRALAIGDVASDDHVGEMGLKPFVQAYGLKALLVAPIRREGGVTGLVVVHRTATHHWDASETEFAAAVADAVALALEREDRAQAVEDLAASQQRYQALAEMTSDYALAVVERDGHAERIQWATGACARVTGYTLAELESLETLRSLVHPASLPDLRALAARWRSEGEGRAEIQITARSGEIRWVDHHVRVGTPDGDGTVIVYHSGQDVTDRKCDEVTLIEARIAAEAGREAAERMNRLKSSFLANMSHEIRTPLTGILGFADLLADEVDAEQRVFVDYIERNGIRLLDTLNAVLDLSQLEAGEYQATPRPTRLADAVREAVGRFRQEATGKDLRFDFEADPSVAALVDGAALGQIAGYLLSNAVKFTDVGGVLVSVEGTPDCAVLRVSDTGVGISEEFLPDAFHAFRQEDIGHTRSHEGSGLGLTVVQRLVDLLGGHIEIESTQPGGTVVTVSFTRVPAPDDGDGPTAASGDGLAASPDVVTFQPTQAASAPAPPDVFETDASPDLRLGTPFDFTFLTAPAPASAAASPETPPHAPTDMFDFRFGRSSAPDSPPSAADPAPIPPPAQPEPVPAPAPPASAAPAPMPSSPAPAAPPAAADPVMIIRAPPSASGPTIPEAVPAAGPPETAEVLASGDDGRPSILVVEDNDDTRMLLDRILRSAYDVTAVGDARSALLAMNQRRFSGLVLDINLGGKETGADVLRIARSLPDYGGVFAIALTAYALPGDRERLLESGFNEYISKPFTRQSLLETLASGVRV